MRERGRMATLFLALLLAAALAACGSGAREPVPEPQADIFVDPGAGSDAGSGSAEQPVRTIGQGLRLAQAGTTVFIRAGTYQDEAWPLSVPDGVSVEGQIQVLARPVLVGSGLPESLAVEAEGNAALSNLSIRGFTGGIGTRTGVLTLQDIVFTDIAEVAVLALDDTEIRAGEVAVADSGAAFVLTGKTRLELENGQFSNLSGAGLLLRDAAAAVVTGLVSQGAAAVGDLTDQAEAEFRDTDVFGSRGTAFKTGGATKLVISGLELHGSAGSAIEAAFCGCTVTVVDSRISDTENDAILVSGRGPAERAVLHLTDSHIGAAADSAVFAFPHSRISIVRSSFTGNGTGIGGLAPFELEMRESQLVDSGGHGLSMGGKSTTAEASRIDLGTSTDAGSNVIRDSAVTNLFITDDGPARIDLSGNSWNAGVQGADGAGRYPAGHKVTGPAAGRNFRLPAGVELVVE